MNIQAAESHLQRVNQPFDVIIEKDGKEIELYKAISPTGVSELLKEVTEAHKPDRLFIQERRKQGSSLVRREKHEVDLGTAPPSPSPLNGVGVGQGPVQPTGLPIVMGTGPVGMTHIPSDFKDYMISDLKDKNQKLEKKVDRLEIENYDLKKERDNLSLDLKTKDREFDISLKEKELEQTNGLSGIIEKVSANEALMNVAGIALSRLMGVDAPSSIPQEASTPGNAPELNRQVAKNLSDWVYTLDEQTCTEFWNMMQLISHSPGQIHELLTILQNQDA